MDSPSVDSMKAVAHFTDLLLPSLLSVAIKDLEESFDPSLVEVSLFSLINQTLNHLGVSCDYRTPRNRANALPHLV